MADERPKCLKCGAAMLEVFDDDPKFGERPPQVHLPGGHFCMVRQLAQAQAELAKTRKRFLRVCDGCGGVVSGAADFPCAKCGSTDGKLIEVAWFAMVGENVRLRGFAVRLCDVVRGLCTAVDLRCAMADAAESTRLARRIARTAAEGAAAEETP